jgi:hypothetical protein
MFGRLAVHILAVLAVVGALSLTGPGEGSAEAASVCSGRPAKTVKLGTAQLRVYKNRSYACATVVTGKAGPRRLMSVSLQGRGGRPAVDKGFFTRQAGPVTVHALHRCVRATGRVAGRKVSTGWILCSERP